MKKELTCFHSLIFAVYDERTKLLLLYPRMWIHSGFFEVSLTCEDVTTSGGVNFICNVLSFLGMPLNITDRAFKILKLLDSVLQN